MIIRDSAYLKNADYHNYRDVDINTLKEAALALAEKGYWVFRMGKVIQKPFKSDHPRILDYANSEYRSDFLDIWLMANCFFCISTGTGLDEVARIFRRPAVYVNNIPLHQLVTYDHVITVPKYLIWEEINKQLTLSKHLAHPYYRTEQYDNEKIKIVDLTPKDIKQAVLEIEARLNGTWKDSEEDQRLQDRFWKIFNSHQDFHKNHGEIHPEARIGADFLRNNPEWLN
jgi:putative glycosyltransferase (TIGR04372 family)